MRFFCKGDSSTTLECSVGDSRVQVERATGWKSFFQPKLHWNWPSGAACELLIPGVNAGSDHNWYVQIDGVRVCTGALKGSWTDWYHHREWQYLNAQILQGKVGGACGLQSVRTAIDSKLLGVWKHSCRSTRGTIRDRCDEIAKIIVFAIMLSERVTD